MYCSNCGAEIKEQSNYCSKCGKPVVKPNENSNTSPIDKKIVLEKKVQTEEKDKIEVVCTYCGSNQVAPVDTNPLAYYVYFVGFGLVALFINAMKWVFAIISIGALLLAVLFTISNNENDKKNVTTWHCKTCNKNFDVPKG